jgi:hypothetical protein
VRGAFSLPASRRGPLKRQQRVIHAKIHLFIRFTQGGFFVLARAILRDIS